MVVFIFTGISNASGLYTENFNYSGLLSANGWSAFSGTGTNALTTVGNTDLSYPGYSGSGGNSVSLLTTGEDDSHPFIGAASQSSGEVYCSALLNVSAAQAIGDYFLSFYSSGGYYGRMFIKSSGAGFTIGISKNSTTPNYSSSTYNFGTTYLVVMHYSFVTGTTNDPVYLYVNPVLGAAEPIGTPTASATVTENDNSTGINMIALRQGTTANTPTLKIDGIIVATTWAEVTSFNYTWNQTGTGDYTVAANWTPARTTPATTDNLIFSNGTANTVTAIPTQTINSLLVTGNTTVNFQAASAANTLSFGNAGQSIMVASGSALNISGANALSLNVLTGAKASISGTMSFTGAFHTLIAVDAGAITFQSGAVLTQNCPGNIFGTSGTAGGVVFANGSEFISQAGSNPFVEFSPLSLVIFQTGSLYSQQQVAVSFNGMVYANYELNYTGGAVTITGTSGFSANNFSIIAGTLNLNLTSAFNNIQINGNISVSSLATLNFNPAIASALTLGGTTPQTITNAGTLTFGANEGLTLNNSAGVTLNSPITIPGVFTLTSGLITTTSTNLLTLGAASTVSGGSATSFVNGPIALTARTTPAMVAPIGKVAAYRPLTATLSSLSGSGTLTAEQIEGPTTGSVTAIGTPLLSAVRHFHITQTGLSSANVNLTLSWGSDDGVLDPTKLTIVGSSDGGLTWPIDRQAPYISYTGVPAAGTVTAASFSLGNLPSGDCTIGSFSGNPLPVNLSSFTAVPSNGAMKLSWKTSVETNNQGFDVERSADKSVWASLAFIQGQGNSNNAKSYS